MQATANASRPILLVHDPKASLRTLIEHAVNVVPAGNVPNKTERHDLYLMVNPMGVRWGIAFLSSEGQMPAMLDALLIKYPAIRIMAIAAHGSPTEMQWLEFPSEILVDVPSAQLAAGLYTAFLSNLMPHDVPTRALCR